MNDYNQISKTFSHLAHLTFQIHSLHENFNKKVDFAKTSVNQSIYGSMTQTFQALQKSFAKNVISVRDTMLKNTKYTKHEISSINEVVKVRNKVCTHYFKMHHDLQEKKLKLFTDGQTGQWGIDIKKVGLPYSQIMKHKDIATHFMLPNVCIQNPNMFLSDNITRHNINCFIANLRTPELQTDIRILQCKTCIRILSHNETSFHALYQGDDRAVQR